MNSPQHAAPRLVFFCSVWVEVGKPIELGVLQENVHRTIPIVGGHFSGLGALGNGQNQQTEAFAGRVLAGGADHQHIVGGTTAHLDARYVLELDTPHTMSTARIAVHNRAIRHASPDDTAKLMRGEAVAPEAVYFRGQPTLQTACHELAWVNHRQFVCTGKRHPAAVEMQFFVVE